MIKTYLPPALTLIVGLVFAAAPAFAPEFRGYAAGQLPVAIDRHAVQPAGYAFSIWGVIFLWLLASAAYGLWRRADHPAWRATRPALIGAMLMGSLWLFLASSNPLLATAVILVMAALALTAFLRADVAVDRWILSAPLAIFAGWVSAASLVSVGIMLGGYGLLPHPTAALSYGRGSFRRRPVYPIAPAAYARLRGHSGLGDCRRRSGQPHRVSHDCNRRHLRRADHGRWNNLAASQNPLAAQNLPAS